jgi:hypothetical protein
MTNKRNIYVICSILSFWKDIYGFVIVDKHIVFNLNHFILYIYGVNRPVLYSKFKTRLSYDYITTLPRRPSVDYELRHWGV